jgi:16S rRNA (adenine1518-N6/adenine1519-N6)-dimethyltransferase
VLKLAELKDLLEARGLAPRHALGQNFLIDHNLLAKLLDDAAARGAVAAGALVLEVGPGPGTLTGPLLERGCRVVACEIDAGMCDLLAERFAGELASGALALVRGDCMERKSALNAELVRALGDGPFAMVANLPYGVASPLMLTLLMRHPACSGMWVTIQREVAERLMAAPGSGDYGELSVLAQALAEIERIALAPPECFWPRPKVTSAMVRLLRRREPETRDVAALEAVCRTLFQKRRKQIGSILGRDAALPEGVRPDQRPEELTVAQLARLAELRRGARGGPEALPG